MPPARINNEIPPKLEDIVNRALEKDRDFRYQSASDMRSELKRLKRDTDSSRLGAASAATTSSPAMASVSGPSSSAAILLGEARKHKRMLALAFGVLLFTAAVGGYFYVRATRTAPKSEQKWEQLTFFTDAAVYPELSPDGRLLTFIRGSSTFLGPGDVYVKMLPSGEPVQLTHDKLVEVESGIFTRRDPDRVWDGGPVGYVGSTSAGRRTAPDVAQRVVADLD